MTTRSKSRRAGSTGRIYAKSAARPPSRGEALSGSGGLLWRLQRVWWILGVFGGAVVLLGFQTYPPSRRLSAIEAVNARQDSVIVVQALTQREALDTIRRQLGQLLAGQCAKETDRMARLLYACR